MPRKPNIAAAISKSFSDARRHTGEGNPLSAVLTDENQARVLIIPIDQIEPNPEQPRKHFDRKALDDLTASVREKGILQPIIVRKRAESTQCIIVAGERRWRAAKAAGLKEMPALLRTAIDYREVALIENMQRKNLNPIEEAEGIADLKATGSYTDAELAKMLGKSRSSITESLSLTQLPEDIKARCRTSDIASKSQLLQVLRAGSPNNVTAAFHALEAGTLRTVRQLRIEKRRTANKTGRPKHARFDWAPESGSYHVTIMFRKKAASRAELRYALKDALKHLP